MARTPSAAATADRHPVDEMLPVGQLLLYGLQHVMSMYAGVIAVPLIVGNALGLPFADLAYLLTAALLVSGLATLLQTLGIWKIGARLPLVQGASFAAVASMLAIGKDAGGGVRGLQFIFGAILVAGIIGFLLSGVFNRLLHFFPPVVTGSVITVIGISLLPVAIRWAGGGVVTAPTFGSPANIGLAALTLLIILVIYRFLPGFFSRVAILLGLVLGTLVAAALGKADFSKIGQAQWFAVSAPFHCALMQPAADVMAEALAGAPLTPPVVPVYANVLAAPIATPDGVRARLVEQVTGRVRWRESVAAMTEAGVTQFVEFGGKVLGPMVKRISPDAAVTSIVTMDDIEALLATV